LSIMSDFTIYSYPNNYRVHKAQIAAAYVGVEIKEPNFVFGKDNESDAFMALNPLGKVPCLKTPQGPIFESNAIAKYIAGLRADKHLLGGNYYENALVSQWVDVCANELENPRAALIYPSLGIMAFNQAVHDEAEKDMTACLTVLNDHLLKNNFIVGKQITLADIAFVSALNELYSKVFAPSYIAKFPNVTRWFTTCCNQPEFTQVLGKVVFNKVETAPTKAVEPQAATASKGSSTKKEDQPTTPEIEVQGNKVRELKARKAPKDEVQAAIDELVRLKAAAATAAGVEKPAESAHKEAKKEESKPAKKDTKKDEGAAESKKKEKASEKPQEASKKGKEAPKAKQPEKTTAPAETAGPKQDDKAVKACFKEGGKKGQDIAGMATFGVHFFCVTVEAAEGDMKLLDKVLEGMNVEVDPEAEDRKGGAGDLGKMLFNANEHKLVIICHTPKEVTEKATAAEWMEGVLKVTKATVVEQSASIIKAEIANDPDNGIFTLKLRDEGMSAAFAFLRSRQLMIEDDSDDDVNYAAAAGINLNAAPGADY